MPRVTMDDHWMPPIPGRREAQQILDVMIVRQNMAFQLFDYVGYRDDQTPSWRNLWRARGGEAFVEQRDERPRAGLAQRFFDFGQRTDVDA